MEDHPPHEYEALILETADKVLDLTSTAFIPDVETEEELAALGLNIDEESLKALGGELATILTNFANKLQQQIFDKLLQTQRNEEELI